MFASFYLLSFCSLIGLQYTRELPSSPVQFAGLSMFRMLIELLHNNNASSFLHVSSINFLVFILVLPVFRPRFHVPVFLLGFLFFLSYFFFFLSFILGLLVFCSLLIFFLTFFHFTPFPYNFFQ